MLIARTCLRGVSRLHPVLATKEIIVSCDCSLKSIYGAILVTIESSGYTLFWRQRKL